MSTNAISFENSSSLLKKNAQVDESDYVIKRYLKDRSVSTKRKFTSKHGFGSVS
jgi:hypothetical protein